MRPSLAALAAAGAAVSLLTPGQTANGRAADVVLKKLTVQPGLTVPGSGAQLNVTALFGRQGPDIKSVSAVGYLPGVGYGPTYPLTEARDGSFQGTCKIPVNRSTVTMRGTLMLLITTAGARQPQQRSVDLKVQPWYDSGPPPPPAK